MDTAERVRALRKALGLTQEKLGSLVGLDRIEVLKVEKGKRKLTGHDVRVRFAQGIGVPTPVLDSYLGGDLAVDVLVRLSNESRGVKAA